MAKFSRGRSGNPRGRPKGSRNLSTQLLAEVNAPAQGTQHPMTKLQAALNAHVAKAAQGDFRAVRDVLERLEKIESDRSAERLPPFTESDRETIDEIHRRLAPRESDDTEGQPEAAA
jgi:hypothetical protein